jgi:hypothetical protein
MRMRVRAPVRFLDNDTMLVVVLTMVVLRWYANAWYAA